MNILKYKILENTFSIKGFLKYTFEFFFYSVYSATKNSNIKFKYSNENQKYGLFSFQHRIFERMTTFSCRSL
ncbi:hypothetical protein BpHYR1_043657 [Brachionus plicatilis]|uniref:Uncharacterized protein n=1 Tax=Brachionus plicatilis TaxID=10195 RepID=A0A3M7PJU6_BRAPC|nr:hypothetical protein BpHYR1_043657 [Brachionus plicatilis]